jgi:hypothetical protein
MASPRLTALGAESVAVSAAVAEGQFVDADQTASTTGPSTVKPASAGSLLCVGVAQIAAAPAGTDSATDAAARPAVTTVHGAGAVVSVLFAASSVYGDRLKVATGGKATPWVDGTDDPAEIVAINVDPAGSVASAAYGYVRLKVS